MLRFLVPALVLAGVLAARPASAQTCAVPDVLLLLDASGSMETLDGGRRRWDVAVEALDVVSSAWDQSVRWGLVVFPSGSTACSLAGAQVPVPATAADVQTALEGLSPGGLTPTADALALARTELATSRRPGHPQSVVLITDGEPNCNARLDGKRCTCTCPKDAPCDCATDARECLDDARTLSAVDALQADGVKVFVIGLGGEVNAALLDQLATRGGTARDVPPGAPLYHVAGDATSLLASLREVTGQVGIAGQACPGDPCGGVQYCTESGFGPCHAFAVGEDLPCDGARGACGAHQVCGASGLSACTAVNAGDQRSCSTVCGDSQQACRADGTWDGCLGVSPGDVRSCTPSYATCDAAGSQLCDTSGWGPCRASHAGDRRSCFTACGSGVETCSADGSWGLCSGASVGDVRACTAQNCLKPGYQLCEAQGLGACICDDGSGKKRCGCSASEGAPFSLLALCVVALRRLW